MEFSRGKGGGDGEALSASLRLGHLEKLDRLRVSLSVLVSVHTPPPHLLSPTTPHCHPPPLHYPATSFNSRASSPLCLLCAQLSYALLATNQDATRAVGGEASWGSASLTRLATRPAPFPSCYPPNCVIKKLKANSCTTTQRTTLSKDDA